MKKHVISVIMIIISLMFSVQAEKRTIIPLPEILKPDAINADKDNIYIIEKSKIHIFSLKNRSVIKTFGKSGEGPGEFKINPQVSDIQIKVIVLDDKLFIHNRRKFFYFSKEGSYISEHRLKKLFLDLIPTNKGYIGYGFKDRSFSLGLYNKDLEEKKEIFKKSVNNPKGKRTLKENKIKILHSPGFRFVVNDGKIYILNKSKFIISKYNMKGNKLQPVKINYENRKLTAKDKNTLLNYYKNHPFWRRKWKRVKKRMDISEFYPAIRTFFIDSHNIYIVTYKIINGQTEIFIINKKTGKYRSNSSLIVYKNPLYTYPFLIKNNKLYQLSINDEEEVELQISGI